MWYGASLQVVSLSGSACERVSESEVCGDVQMG